MEYINFFKFKFLVLKEIGRKKKPWQNRSFLWYQNRQEEEKKKKAMSKGQFFFFF